MALVWLVLFVSALFPFFFFLGGGGGRGLFSCFLCLIVNLVGWGFGVCLFGEGRWDTGAGEGGEGGCFGYGWFSFLSFVVLHDLIISGF